MEGSGGVKVHTKSAKVRLGRGKQRQKIETADGSDCFVWTAAPMTATIEIATRPVYPDVGVVILNGVRFYRDK